MKKEKILKDLLEDYGWTITVFNRKYLPKKSDYWFDVKIYNEKDDESYRLGTEFGEKKWMIYDFLNTRYSIITNMQMSFMMDLKIKMDALLYN